MLSHYTKALSVALGYRDAYTLLHSGRVVQIATGMADQIGVTGGDCEILSIAAAFHDVGKLGIPDRVLLKPGRLAPEEREVIERHSEMGAEIILATGLDGCEGVARVIRHHHEWWNGEGYPDRLAGNDIPLLSRIIGIADSYDAMAVTRSYSASRSHTQIMAILEEESGRKHDPALMAVFRDVVRTIVRKPATA